MLRYGDFADAVTLANDAPQGLSSAIFTNDMREAELFLSALGFDCGIANVNTGPSGAEIGGAAKRKLAAGAKAARIPGKPICAARRKP